MQTAPYRGQHRAGGSRTCSTRVDPEVATRSASARKARGSTTTSLARRVGSRAPRCSRCALLARQKNAANRDQQRAPETPGNSLRPEQQDEASCISSTERVQVAWGGYPRPRILPARTGNDTRFALFNAYAKSIRVGPLSAYQVYCNGRNSYFNRVALGATGCANFSGVCKRCAPRGVSRISLAVGRWRGRPCNISDCGLEGGTAFPPCFFELCVFPNKQHCR